MELDYQDIVKATENFNSKYLTGRGGFGNVYKAELPTGQVVAVKKLHQTDETSLSPSPAQQSSFDNEVKALMEIRHRNVVKLYGFCSNRNAKVLVYKYMEKGSLGDVLRSDEEAARFCWSKRLSAVRGMAHALAYMHHDCAPPIVHRDVSSGNVLLDSEYEVGISDFGTARLLNPDSSVNSTSVVAGTYGYVAPGMHIC